MEFKGTKGKWNIERHIHPQAGYLILDNDNFQIAISDNDYIENIDKCRYNALLISKAPEMLEMLSEIVENYKIGNEDNFIMSNLIDKSEQLIKEATELN